MSKIKDNTNLEYYKAKKDAGQIHEMKSTTKVPVNSVSEKQISQNKSGGYVDMIQLPPEKQREFERYKEITFAQKASEKAKRNPMIPIGLLATVAALTLGLRAVSRGDSWQSQMMMRARLGAQGFTILAVLASIMYSGYNPEPVENQSSTSRSSSS